MKKYFLFLLLIFLLLVTACGRNRNETNDNGANNMGGGGSVPTVTYDYEVITVSGHISEERWLRDAANALISKYGAMGRNVRVEFIFWEGWAGDDSWHEHNNRMLSMAMAGMTPDVMLMHRNHIPTFIRNGFLADINEFINHSLFHENVLRSFEINWSLYTIPREFRFKYIGINSNLPQSYIDRFRALDSISIVDIAVFYMDLINDYPEFADFYIVHDLMYHWWLETSDISAPVHMDYVVHEFNNHIDFYTGTVDLSGMYDFINNLNKIFENNRGIDMQFANYFTQHIVAPTNQDMRLLQENYVFHIFDEPINAFFEFEDRSFIHFIPMADTGGRVINDMGMSGFVLGSGATQLAYDFVELALSLDTEGEHIPIMREQIRRLTKTQGAMARIDGRPFIGSVSDNTDNMTNRINEIAELPISSNIIGLMFLNLWSLLENPTIESIAEVEIRLYDWLNPPEVIIEPYVPVETPDNVAVDLTERTLTIRTTEMFVTTIEQAARELNASWTERGEPYFLNLNIEKHEDISFTGDTAGWLSAIEARDARFRTELMSGIVSDLVFNDDFTFFTDGFYHQFSLGGHLMDFYTLIDNCPVTSRDDFFMNAITAREFMGGVYELPMLFGFNYIGINNNIPQDFIDRFTAMSSISLSDTLRLYLELLDNHPTQFGGMNTGLTTLGRQLNAFTLHLPNFIDFNALTANFINSELTESLELAKTFNARQNLPAGVRGHIDIQNISTLREHAVNDMFLVGWSGLAPVDAFFQRDSVPFTHFIPLTDDYGRLIIAQPLPFARPNTDPNVWIPSGGDVDLAWEFTRYLIKAFSQPESAIVIPSVGSLAPLGNNTLRIPIMRSLFDSHMQSVFENITEISECEGFGFNTGAEFTRETEIAKDRIYEYANAVARLLISLNTSIRLYLRNI